MASWIKLGDDPPISLPTNGEFVIGRDPKTCALVLDHDELVSRVHAKISPQEGGYAIEDAGSRNGTYVNGTAITGRVQLKLFDRVRIGQVDLSFLFDPDAGREGPPDGLPDVRTSPGTTRDNRDNPDNPDNPDNRDNRDNRDDPDNRDNRSQESILSRINADKLHDRFVRTDEDNPDMARVNSQLISLYTISEKLVTIRDLGELLREILDELFRILPIDRGIVLLRNRAGELEPGAHRSDVIDDPRVPPLSRTLLKQVVAERHAILVPDTRMGPMGSPSRSVLLHHMRSVACVPMIMGLPPREGRAAESAESVAQQASEGEIVGVLQVHSTGGVKNLDARDLDLLVGIGRIAAVAIRNARLHEEQEMRRKQLEFVYELERAVGDEQDFQQFLDEALRKAVQSIEGTWGSLYIKDSGPTGDLHTTYPGTSEAAETSPPPASIGRRGLENAVSSFHPILGREHLDGIPLDPSVPPVAYAIVPIPGPVSPAVYDPSGTPSPTVPRGTDAIPQSRSTENRGAIGVARDRGGRFLPQDLAVLQILAAQVGTALHRKRLHDEREDNKRLATIGRVTGSIIHDFRSPMTVILGYAQLLGEPSLDEPTRNRYRKLIISATNRCSNMTQELMEFAGGVKRYVFTRVESDEFLSEIALNLDNEMRTHQIEFAVDDQLRGPLVFDGDKMKRVLYNLSSNAVDALQPGKKFSIRIREESGDVVIEVEDDGPGIPLAIRDRIFEPFVTQGKKHGTGLGLAICQDILSGHGGCIELDLTRNQGTRFLIRFPRNLTEGERVVETAA